MGLAYRKGLHLLADTLADVSFHSSCSPLIILVDTH